MLVAAATQRLSYLPTSLVHVHTPIEMGFFKNKLTSTNWLPDQSSDIPEGVEKAFYYIYLFFKKRIILSRGVNLLLSRAITSSIYSYLSMSRIIAALPSYAGSTMITLSFADCTMITTYRCHNDKIFVCSLFM